MLCRKKFDVYQCAILITSQYGDVLSRITNDVDTLSNALQQTLTEMMRGLLMLMLAIFMMFRIHVLMTVLFC